MNVEIQNRINNFTKKLIKDKKAIAVIVLGIIGMIFIMLSGTDEKGNTNKNQIKDYMLYCETDTLNKVTELIENINGAGDTKVMITYECSEETVFAADTDENHDNNSSDKSLEYIIIEENNGETGLKIKTVYPKVMGVAIVCQGGDNPVVKKQIISVISALFNLSTNKISVASMA